MDNFFTSAPKDIFYLLLDYIRPDDIVNLVSTCKNLYYTECYYYVYPDTLCIKKQINKYDTYWYWNVFKLSKFSDYCSAQRLITNIRRECMVFMCTMIYGFTTNIPVEILEIMVLNFSTNAISKTLYEIKKYIDFNYVCIPDICTAYLCIVINQYKYHINFLRDSEKLVGRHASLNAIGLQIRHSTNSRISINNKRYFIAFHTGPLVFEKR